MQQHCTIVKNRISKNKFEKSTLKDIKKLYKYDNWHAMFALFQDYFFIIIAIVLSEYSYYFLPLSILVIGSRQRALATILHEASHYALTSNKKFSKILGTYFSGYLIFQSWNSYISSHVKEHHPKLGTNLDPDYSYYIDSGIFEDHSKTSFFWNYLVKPIMCLNIIKNVEYLIKNRLLVKSTKRELLAIIASQALLFAVGSYFVGYHFYILYWLIPYFTTFQTITWFIEIAEHYPMINSATTNLEASRNRFSNPIEGFFTSMHNENYHLIHHLFPGIPFWNLPKAHGILMKNEEYALINQNFGGIFISTNGKHSMWYELWEKYNIKVNKQ